MGDEELFDLDLWGEPVKPPVYPPWFFAGKNTPRIHVERVARGWHPIGLDLGPETSRCGACSHSYYRGYATKRYWKCDLVKATSGAATDIKLKWRGCARFDERKPE